MGSGIDSRSPSTYEIVRRYGGSGPAGRRRVGRTVDRDVPRPARHQLTRRGTPAARIAPAARRVLSHEDARVVPVGGHRRRRARPIARGVRTRRLHRPHGHARGQGAGEFRAGPERRRRCLQSLPAAVHHAARARADTPPPRGSRGCARPRRPRSDRLRTGRRRRGHDGQERRDRSKNGRFVRDISSAPTARTAGFASSPGSSSTAGACSPTR